MSGNFAIEMTCRLPDGSQMVSNMWIWSDQTMPVYKDMFKREIQVGIPTEEAEEWLIQRAAEKVRYICQQARKQYEHQKEDQTYLRARETPESTEEAP